MTGTIEPTAAAPEVMREWQRAMTRLTAFADFDPALIELVKVRASQINGCANCINLHVTWARERGVSDQKINLLPAWREAPCYDDREWAALLWTETLTRLSEGRELNEARAALKAHFTDEEQVKLTVAINVINGWNRIAVGFDLFADPEAIRAAAREAA